MQTVHSTASSIRLRLRVKQLAEHITDSGPCAAALRRSMEGPYERRPSDFDSMRWSIEHGALTRQYQGTLHELGYRVYREGANSFEVPLRRCNGVELPVPVVIAGRPDLVAIGKEDCVVADAKTGRDSITHQVQVLLYQLFLPLVPPPLYADRIRSVPLCGQVVYKHSTIVSLPATAPDAEFRHLVAATIVRLATATDTTPEPSAQACRFCDVADCSMRYPDGQDRPEDIQNPFVDL